MIKSKMKHSTFILLTICLMLTLFSSSAIAAETLTATPSRTFFLMNDIPMSISQAYNVNDNNYLQLRAIAVLLNGTEAQFNVSWDGNYAVIETGKPYTGEATPTLMGNTSNVRTSSTSFKIDDNVVTLDKVYLIDGDTNYLQLREVAEKLSGTKSQFNVYWDNDLAQAIIKTGEPYTNVNSSSQEVTSSEATSVLTMEGWNNAIKIKGNWTVEDDPEVGEAVNFFSDADGLLTVVYLNDVGVISSKSEFIENFLLGIEDSGIMHRIKPLQNRTLSGFDTYQYLYEYRDGDVFDTIVSIIFTDNDVILLMEVYSMTERLSTEEINYVADSIVEITKEIEVTTTTTTSTPIHSSVPTPAPAPAPTPTPTPTPKSTPAPTPRNQHYTASYGPRGGAICWCGRYMSQH